MSTAAEQRAAHERSPFKGLTRDPRDVQAPPGSINAQLLELPEQRFYTHDVKGMLLLLPRTGLIVVPFQESGDSHWSCVVVDGSAVTKEDGSHPYPRGGYHIDVSELELTTAIELTVVR
ncbi:hypothetical protein [Pseudolysinimonas sp.]|uniref:hypothetical protein n=1 Tax=Pseudolysinimonas sp. TaxID=2680009 RepID=UPI003F7D6AC0